MSDFRDLVHDPKHKRRFEELLRLAASRGDTVQVVERLSWGIDPNAAGNRGGTALIINVAGSSPSSGVVNALLKAGAECTLLDHKGLSALDYARRKLARLNLKPGKPPPKSRSLDENGQLILAKFEQKMLDGVRRKSPRIAKEFVEGYLRQRLKAARHVFNDPVEIEKVVELLEAAERQRR